MIIKIVAKGDGVFDTDELVEIFESAGFKNVYAKVESFRGEVYTVVDAYMDEETFRILLENGSSIKGFLSSVFKGSLGIFMPSLSTYLYRIEHEGLWDILESGLIEFVEFEPEDCERRWCDEYDTVIRVVYPFGIYDWVMSNEILDIIAKEIERTGISYKVITLGDVFPEYKGEYAKGILIRIDEFEKLLE